MLRVTGVLLAGAVGWAFGGLGTLLHPVSISAAPPVAVPAVAGLPSTSSSRPPVLVRSQLSLITEQANLVAMELGRWGFGSAQGGVDTSATLSQKVDLQHRVDAVAVRYNQEVSRLRQQVLQTYVSGETAADGGIFSSVRDVSRWQSKAIYEGLSAGVYSTVSRGTQNEIDALTRQIGDLNRKLAVVAAANSPIVKVPVSTRVPMIGSRGFGVETPEVVPTSIQGTAVLTAEQLSSWYNAVGFVNMTGVPIRQVAAIYLDEGSAENVRGDIAFMQSVLETGGFSIMSGSNNFAGIGACDSCNGGYDYPSLRFGVRAQIELLRSYSDANFRTADIHRAVAYHGIDTLYVRGCCPNWVDLGGVWASGKLYGQEILHLYLTALMHAMMRS